MFDWSPATSKGCIGGQVEESRCVLKASDSMHRTTLPVSIFRRWTWASLNFGQLKLASSSWSENTSWQGHGYSWRSYLLLCVSQGYVHFFYNFFFYRMKRHELHLPNDDLFYCLFLTILFFVWMYKLNDKGCFRWHLQWFSHLKM